MNLGSRLRLGAVAVGVILLIAGCTSGAADGPASTGASSAAVSPSVIDPSSLGPASSSAAPASTSPNPSPTGVEQSAPSSSGLSPQEAADRAAIEAQWAKFWRTYVDIVRTPADQREAALAGVSIDPTKSRVLKDAADFDQQGLDNYGDVVLNVYQIDFIGGGTAAVLQDCQDQSGFGSIVVDSGKKRTVGIVDNHMQAGFVRGSDGVWRVQTLQYVENQPC